MAEVGITDFAILEATDRIGGRIHNTKFAGVNVEMGANWVEGVNGDEMNPIWTTWPTVQEASTSGPSAPTLTTSPGTPTSKSVYKP
jgi:phytoene dehydrogenase-like protein